ncbi:MAG: hypothetical protein K0R94_86, partial [Burkholderiales bacterium]|nr:hypothetical protein [Burkholderiales bacterium]
YHKARKANLEAFDNELFSEEIAMLEASSTSAEELSEI